jgi:hypothetical protein
MLRQWRSNRWRSFQRTTDTGTRRDPSSWWPTEYPYLGQRHDTYQQGLCELRITCGLPGAPPDKEQSTTDYVADVVEWLQDIHHYAHQHLKTDATSLESVSDGTIGQKWPQ